jgi:hypothetical protein
MVQPHGSAGFVNESWYDGLFLAGDSASDPSGFIVAGTAEAGTDWRLIKKGQPGCGRALVGPSDTSPHLHIAIVVIWFVQ